jgi:3-phenylpropionate/trans-cinnamate dioxygenase ferredoxin reductase subunit
MSDRAVDILLIGGGIASAGAAAELRAGGFDGSITLVTREQDPPYHRPPITKGYLQGREDRASTLVHPQSWYADHDVELLRRTPVMELDTEARTAKLGRAVVGFDQALDALRADVEPAQRVAIVGGSYIATEVAASLTLLGKRCTLLMQEALPTERGFGPVVGAYVRDLLTSHGIEIVAEADVVEFAGEGEEGRVATVVCADGRRVEADLVVVGVGATPDVMLARKAGLQLGESGGVACDGALRTSVEGIFAAGDMCEYDSAIHGRRLRIEHEEVAAAQGRHVARAMLGSEAPYTEVPYFWSDLADWATIECVGPAAAWQEEIVRGDPASGSFSVFYLDGGRLAATLAVDRAEDLAAARSLIAEGAGAEAVRALA